MIHLTLPVDEYTRGAILPSIDLVVGDILDFLGVPDDIPAINVDSVTGFKHSNWNVGNTKWIEENGINRQGALVEHTISLSPGMTNVLNDRRNNNHPLLYDKITGLKLMPKYTSFDVALSIVITSKSKTVMTSIADKLNMLHIKDGGLTKHTTMIVYSSKDILGLVSNINRIRNEVYGEDTSVYDYLKSIGDKRFTAIDNQGVNGTTDTVAFKEVRHGAIGTFASQIYDIPIHYNDGYYTIEFDYIFTFDRVTELELWYNVQAYNVMLDEEYITMIREPEIMYKLSYDQYMMQWFARETEVMSLISKMRRNDNYVRIPMGDIHAEPETPDYMVRIMSVLVSITNDDRRCLFNLGDTPEVELQDYILNFFRDSEYPYLGEFLASAFYVELYENDSKSPIALTIDSDLNVCASKDLDIDKLYRVYINYIPFANYLKKDAIDRLINNQEILNQTVSVLKYIDGETDVQPTVDNSIYFTDGYLSTAIIKFNEYRRVSQVFISSILTRMIRSI